MHSGVELESGLSDAAEGAEKCSWDARNDDSCPELGDSMWRLEYNNNP